MNVRTATIVGRIALIGIAIVMIGTAILRIVHGEKPLARASATTDQRVARGPHIAQVKEISETETVRVLVIPHPLGEFFDTTCVIYTHRTFNTATFVCPDADKMNLRDSIRDNELQRPLR